jgi:hypothetical protein
MSCGAADVDDAGMLKVVAEHVDDTIARAFVEGIEDLVDENPGRSVQQRPRKRQTLLFIVAQFAIPAPRQVE